MDAADRIVIDAGDVCVIGAGVAGLLTAEQMAVTFGLTSLVLDSTAVGAAQSGHHHGKLHWGTLYIGDSEALVAELLRSRQLWDQYLDGVAAQSHSTLVPVWDPLRVPQVQAWWAARKIPVRVAPEVPDWLVGPTRVFATSERSYDVSTVLASLANNVAGVRTGRCRVTRLRFYGTTVVGVEATAPDGTEMLVVAGRYVLAAGCGMESLLAASGVHRGRLTVRTSFMAVIETEGLPAEDVIVVERHLGGLFTGVRIGPDGRRRWLVGDQLSLAGVVNDGRMARRWLHSTVSKLRRLTTVLDGAGVRIGVYAAPKAELRFSPHELSPFAVDSYGTTNLVVTTPSKLTLAPAMAARAAEVVARLSPTAHVGDTPELPALGVAPERWVSTPTEPLDAFGQSSN